MVRDNIEIQEITSIESIYRLADKEFPRNSPPWHGFVCGAIRMHQLIANGSVIIAYKGLTEEGQMSLAHAIDDFLDELNE